MQRAAPQKKMRRLVLAAVLHVAATNNCERATDLKPEHICRAPTNPDALRGAIPDLATDALPLHGGTPPSLEIAPGRVEKQKARLLRKANTEGAPLVWVLDDYVGIGNALDAYVRAVIEARHRRRSLIIKSPILRNLCRIVACEGLGSAKREDLSRTERLCLASSHQNTDSKHCVYYTTFGWRNGKYPPDYNLPQVFLTDERRAILRELLPRREHGELFKRFLPTLEKAFVGASVEEAVAPTQRYAVALHLRTLDFIEGIDLRGHQPVAFLLRETSASLHAIDRVDDRVDGVMGSTQARTLPTPPHLIGSRRGRRASNGPV